MPVLGLGNDSLNRLTAWLITSQAQPHTGQESMGGKSENGARTAEHATRTTPVGWSNVGRTAASANQSTSVEGAFTAMHCRACSWNQ